MVWTAQIVPGETGNEYPAAASVSGDWVFKFYCNEAERLPVKGRCCVVGFAEINRYIEVKVDCAWLTMCNGGKMFAHEREFFARQVHLCEPKAVCNGSVNGGWASSHVQEFSLSGLATSALAPRTKPVICVSVMTY